MTIIAWPIGIIIGMGFIIYLQARTVEKLRKENKRLGEQVAMNNAIDKLSTLLPVSPKWSKKSHIEPIIHI